jgi:hypothetical protein
VRRVRRRYQDGFGCAGAGGTVSGDAAARTVDDRRPIGRPESPENQATQWLYNE